MAEPQRARRRAGNFFMTILRGLIEIEFPGDPLRRDGRFHVEVELQGVLGVAVPEGGQRIPRDSDIVIAVPDRRMNTSLCVVRIAAEFADEDDLAGGDARRAALRLCCIGRRCGRGCIGADRRFELFCLHKFAEGIHRIADRVGEAVASEDHLGRGAEERSFPRQFRRPVPVGRNLFAPQVGTEPMVPVLLISPLHHRRGGGRIDALVAAVEGEGGPDLFEIVHAADLLGAFPRLVQSWKQHGGQNCDDGYYIDLKKLIS